MVFFYQRFINLNYRVENSHYNTYVKYDCFKWGMKKKEEGKIRHFGFSYHGSPELLSEILDQHPEVEFVQIQLNYLDRSNPVVRSQELYDILAERNIPIIVMEPIRGGMLANMSPEIEAKFTSCRPDKSVASWALRFVASLEGVSVVLS